MAHWIDPGAARGAPRAHSRDATVTAHSVGVVIPTLNEGRQIEACLASLNPLREAGAHVLLSDGGSDDDTVERAARAGVQVLDAPRGRALQMNVGAAAVGGHMLWFVHADSRLTPRACAAIVAIAGQGVPVWGRFDVTLSGPGAAFRTIETCMNVRSRLTGIATGDQCLFVSRDLFDATGGFPELPLMEDIALSQRLRAVQAPRCVADRVVTSSRKWRREGVLRTVLLMWRLRLAYALGADPADLARRY